MCPKIILLTLNTKLIKPKSADIAIGLNYSLVCAVALRALGRRFESCRPDQL